MSAHETFNPFREPFERASNSLDLPDGALHEAGHAVLAHFCGCKVEDLRFNPLTEGGVTHYTPQKAGGLSAQESLTVLVAGEEAVCLYGGKGGPGVGNDSDHTEIERIAKAPGANVWSARMTARMVLTQKGRQLEILARKLTLTGLVLATEAKILLDMTDAELRLYTGEVTRR